MLAAGFKPNVELAADAGMELGRSGAIRTDERMETNLRGVYAAGDCAEVQHIVTGRPTYIPLGTTANKAGRVAGANAAGARERFAGMAGTSIVGISGWPSRRRDCPFTRRAREGFSPGRRASKPKPGRDTSAAARRSSNWLRTEHAPTGRRLRDRRRRSVGPHQRDRRGAQARMKVDDFESLDLAYSPPFAPVWDPLLIAAQQLIKELSVRQTPGFASAWKSGGVQCCWVLRSRSMRARLRSRPQR